MSKHILIKIRLKNTPTHEYVIINRVNAVFQVPKVVKSITCCNAYYIGNYTQLTFLLRYEPYNTHFTGTHRKYPPGGPRLVPISLSVLSDLP